MNWAKFKSHIVGSNTYKITNIEQYDKVTIYLIRNPFVPAIIGAVLGLTLGLLCSVCLPNSVTSFG